MSCSESVKSGGQLLTISALGQRSRPGVGLVIGWDRVRDVEIPVDIRCDNKVKLCCRVSGTRSGMNVEREETGSGVDQRRELYNLSGNILAVNPEL
jgi:hypothetical protein